MSQSERHLRVPGQRPAVTRGDFQPQRPWARLPLPRPHLLRRLARFPYRFSWFHDQRLLDRVEYELGGLGVLPGHLDQDFLRVIPVLFGGDQVGTSLGDGQVDVTLRVGCGQGPVADLCAVFRFANQHLGPFQRLLGSHVVLGLPVHGNVQQQLFPWAFFGNRDQYQTDVCISPGEHGAAPAPRRAIAVPPGHDHVRSRVQIALEVVPGVGRERNGPGKAPLCQPPGKDGDLDLGRLVGTWLGTAKHNHALDALSRGWRFGFWAGEDEIVGLLSVGDNLDRLRKPLKPPRRNRRQPRARLQGHLILPGMLPLAVWPTRCDAELARIGPLVAERDGRPGNRE